MTMPGPGRLVVTVLCGLATLACSAPATPAPSTPPPATAARAAPAKAMARSVPVSVEVPRIGARSTLIPLGLNGNRAVQVPSVHTPMQAGWFTGAPTPGEAGPAVILGHVDGDNQAGIFFRLRELKPGDDVPVRRTDGRTARFVVTSVDVVPKDRFPTEQVYGNTAGSELRLITCGGSFDKAAHSYRDNVIVYAALG